MAYQGLDLAPPSDGSTRPDEGQGGGGGGQLPGGWDEWDVGFQVGGMKPPPSVQGGPVGTSSDPSSRRGPFQVLRGTIARIKSGSSGGAGPSIDVAGSIVFPDSPPPPPGVALAGSSASSWIALHWQPLALAGGALLLAPLFLSGIFGGRR